MKRSLSIEVYFDFICPWCLIGRRQLQRAIARLREAQPEVEISLAWRGIQLLPEIAPGGLPFAEFYRQRLGSDEAVRQRQGQVQEAAKAVAEHIEFERIQRMPNTADAHRLLRRVTAMAGPAQVEALMERLFAAYFQQGQDLGDRETLLGIAQTCGFAANTVAGSLCGDGRPLAGTALVTASRGVPYFVFDDHLAVVGAQPAEVLLEAMRQALACSPEAVA